MSNQAKIDYAEQLEEKVQRLSALLAPFSAPDLSVYESAPQHYRMRAEFRVWHDGDDLYHIMFDQQSKEKYRVDHFAPASRTINDMMQALLEQLKPSQVLRGKLFQIDYLTGLSGEIVVSLLYHKALDENWIAAAQTLRAQLSKDFNVSIIGRARKQKHIIGNDFIIETLPINGKDYHFKHIENSFTQPNAEVNCRMIEWALSVSAPSSSDLLELYCGAGNFSLPMAQNFRKVIGTEIAKPSVNAAQYNIETNHIDNVAIVRLSAEEFVEAMKGKRQFSRLGEIDLSSYNFSTVLVDPPRAGLDEESVKMIQDYDEIIYISCNPETLCENLRTLIQTHRISHAALFDQFPFTHHMEAGVKLVKK
ncbi:tRNA (uridine(54)-C5)-methyltransferase TrmA [Alteromonas aestuariivivens]|uniref:tRNA/tmRNA (uracil-C(5))-methyltransferase n=1 Tax=Alteromonas aestuariivivens TaxID=1938339 RepID=A0A3D8M2S2_9ALTE|nr:tRNA (uridine(54)-C5)-methyltransferase TrmA [Alteromonas aestuariivivens]RDV24027.1 tRNA (uridine(54)-C5)-methyltransferase TrmA [Alteromonas aestuariivivens]